MEKVTHSIFIRNEGLGWKFRKPKIISFSQTFLEILSRNEIQGSGSEPVQLRRLKTAFLLGIRTLTRQKRPRKVQLYYGGITLVSCTHFFGRGLFYKYTKSVLDMCQKGSNIGFPIGSKTKLDLY